MPRTYSEEDYDDCLEWDGDINEERVYTVTVHDGIEEWADPDTGSHHRVGGPAIVNHITGAKSWLQNGVLHNAHGPAEIDGDGNEFYYYKDHYFETKREWLEYIESEKEQNKPQTREDSREEILEMISKVLKLIQGEITSK